MGLRGKQSEFALAVGKLLLHMYDSGYEVSIGDAWAIKGSGRKHSHNSKHYIKLAIDLNLFFNDKYLACTEDHVAFGRYWEQLGGIWGGRFDDGNHYEWPVR